MSQLLNLLRRSSRLFVTLVKVMLPVMILVQLAQQFGWTDALGRAIAPAMGLLNLPPEAGMIWVTGMLVGVYGAIGAMIGLAASLELTVGQLSALCSMVLFAHALPVEQSIVRRAGASFWATAALRVGAAVIYGGLVSWSSKLSGVMSEPVSLDWLPGSALAPESAEGAAGFASWVAGTSLSLLMTFGIIVGLLILLDVLERTGLTRRITSLLAPLLRFSGLEEGTAPVTTVGVLLGLSYGGALIIEEADKEIFDARQRFLALAWLSLSHSLIEDTVLFLALGANLWIILVGRVLVTMVLVAALARLLDGGDSAGAGADAGTKGSSFQPRPAQS